MSKIKKENINFAVIWITKIMTKQKTSILKNSAKFYF